jgi:hypothetical protein
MSDARVEIRIDRSRCVLCGQPNDCALAREGQPGDGPCWCVDETFPTSLRERARAKDDGASCICRACLARETSDQDARA